LETHSGTMSLISHAAIAGEKRRRGKKERRDQRDKKIERLSRPGRRSIQKTERQGYASDGEKGSEKKTMSSCSCATIKEKK